MLSRTAVSLALVLPALASWLPTPGEVFQEASELVHSVSDEFIMVEHDFLDVVSGLKRKRCELRSSGGDDTDGFESAVKTCGIGGIIDLPDVK